MVISPTGVGFHLFYPVDVRDVPGRSVRRVQRWADVTSLLSPRRQDGV